MSRNPYEVLGITEEASTDEIKKAYRKKARENHPDTNPNDPGASERMNEINEAYDRIINPEKYRKRTPDYGPGASPGYTNTGGYYGGSGSEQRRSASGQGGYYGNNQNYGYGQRRGPETQDPYGWAGGINFDDLFGFGWDGQQGGEIHPEVSASDSPEFRRAIEYINTKNYQQADALLRSIPSGGRNARWYYLSALSHKGTGNILSAQESIRKAVRLEPNNQDYVRAQRNLQSAGYQYQQASQQRGFSTGTVNPALLCAGCCAAQYFIRFLCFGF